MAEDNTEKVRGNPIPIMPAVHVPSIVRMSAVPKPPTPIVKEEMEDRVIKNAMGDPGFLEESMKSVGLEVEEEVDARPKGTIVIKVFENSPYEVDFSGMITGSEVDMAWKAMMKEYRVWKNTLFKKQEHSGGV
ncbi:MAG: hypothetical protein MUP81_02185 [Dehalococcoidia bacterium]|nr:hypothetical protein [Dehalococcoidia bacterium]